MCKGADIFLLETEFITLEENKSSSHKEMIFVKNFSEFYVIGGFPK